MMSLQKLFQEGHNKELTPYLMFKYAIKTDITRKYYEKIVKNYSYDPYTGEYNEKMLPKPKEEKQRKNIAKDFKAYFKTLDEYADFLKELIKKYDIKLTGGNLLKVAFNLNNNDDDSEYKQRPFKFIRVNVDGEDVFTNI